MMSKFTGAILLGGSMGPVIGLQFAGKDVPLESARSETDRRHPRIIDADAKFSDFISLHGRAYQKGSEEYATRFSLFQQRAAEVEEHNSRADRMWTAALNKFSDHTDAERASYRGYRRKERTSNSPSCHHLDEAELANLPSTVGTSYKNMYNAWIRDQASCGSCWAVTASTVLGFHSELHSTNQSFSTQEIVDCVPNPNECGGQGGCQGATVELAFQYAMSKGLRDPHEYGSYTATDGTCDWTPSAHTEPTLQYLTEDLSSCGVRSVNAHAIGPSFGMSGWESLQSNKMLPLMHAVHNRGPVAVALAANDIMMYSSGIFNSCGDWTVNHAVTLIGYGEEDGEKYWLVQNSWGPDWGEEGRIKIQRTSDEDSNCGTDNDPQAGLACKGETDPVEVCGTCGILYDSVVPHFHAVN